MKNKARHMCDMCAQVRRGYSVLLESKTERWHAQRRALVEAIQDLAAFYQALQALPRSTSTADLSNWFDNLIEQVRQQPISDSSDSHAPQVHRISPPRKPDAHAYVAVPCIVTAIEEAIPFLSCYMLVRTSLPQP